MGGLLLLYSIAKYDLESNIAIMIEPSICDADNDFFNYVSEPPNGIGFDNFKSGITDLGDYTEIYRQNLEKSNKSKFIEFEAEINKRTRSKLSRVHKNSKSEISIFIWQ